MGGCWTIKKPRFAPKRRKGGACRNTSLAALRCQGRFPGVGWDKTELTTPEGAREADREEHHIEAVLEGVGVEAKCFFVLCMKPRNEYQFDLVLFGLHPVNIIMIDHAA